MKGFLTVIDKAFILKHVSEEEIFEKYMQTRIYPGVMYRSVLRHDKRPTCSFIYTKGKLKMKDFNGSFFDDCFAFVQAKFGIGYHEAIQQIAEDFKLTTRKTKRKPREFNHDFQEEPSEIKVQWRELEEKDILYWGSFGISQQTLAYFHVGAIKFLWIDGKLRYSYSGRNRAFGYWFSESEIKAYFVDREEYRFLGNYRGLQGYRQLPDSGELLIITKSYKDVMYYRQLGIYAVAPASESSILTKEEYKDLSSRFTKILVNYDLDLTGVRSTKKMKKAYGLDYFFIRDKRDVGPKDLTDYHKEYGSELTKQLIMKKLETCK